MHMLGEPRTMQSEPRYERRRGRGEGVPSTSAWTSPCARACARSGSCSTRASASARPSSTTSSCLRRLDELTELGRPLVVGTSRKSFLGRILAGAEGQPARRRRGGCRGRSPRTCSRSSAARACFASTTSPRARRAGRGGCYVGRAMDGQETGEDGGRARRRGSGLRGRSRGRRSPGDRRVGHDRDHRPLAVHAPRGQRGRARGRTAARPRPAAGRRRNRRHRDRLDRGHGRLCRGLPAGGARRPAALAQDARAAVQHDRRPAARRLRARGRVGEGEPSPSRRSRSASTRSPSRSGAKPRADARDSAGR